MFLKIDTLGALTTFNFVYISSPRYEMEISQKTAYVGIIDAFNYESEGDENEWKITFVMNCRCARKIAVIVNKLENIYHSSEIRFDFKVL